MEWICEWHSNEAAEIASEDPTKDTVIYKYCPKCHCVTLYARIEAKENEQ